MDLYTQRLQKLQKEFLEINKKRANKWQFSNHQQIMYDFVMQQKKSSTMTINDQDIKIYKGDENFGFKHILLRHYCDNCPGEITARDILNIGNVIKQNIIVPSKKEDRINYIQNKNEEKYTVVLTKKKNGDLIFTFFSSK